MKVNTSGIVKVNHYVDEVPDFLISNLITNKQFTSFIDASDGYNDNSSWPSAWHSSNPNPLKSYPQNESDPRVNVNFYEAGAFCQWLTMKVNYGSWDKVTNGASGAFFYHITPSISFFIPSENHWQRAAKEGALHKSPSNKVWEWTETYIDRFGSEFVSLEESSNSNSLRKVTEFMSFNVVRGGTKPFNTISPMDDSSRYMAPREAQVNSIGFRIICLIR